MGKPKDGNAKDAANWRREARSVARKNDYKVIRPKGSYHPPAPKQKKGK